MTTIPALPASGPISAGAAARQGGFAAGSDFTMFLKMLTTQMQNQNPLNPVEAADFAVQLATFSGVEQQVQTNHYLARLTERALSEDVATWLGAQVAADGQIRITGDPFLLHLPAAPDGTTHRDVVLATPLGQEVARFPLPVDQITLGIDPSSVANLSNGHYHASVQDFDGDDLVQTAQAAQFATVTEVRKGPAGTQLVLVTGEVIDPASVLAARRP